MKIAKTVNKRIVPALLAALYVMTAVPIAAAAAESFPSRPIRIVVPFTAGGNTDNGARLLAQGLAEELKQSVLVENKTGAGSVIGTEEVARSKSDGHTLLITTVAFAVNPSLRKSLSYDSRKDFAPVALMALSPMMLLANPSVPANDIPELIDYIKNHNNVSYGSAGSGSAMHLAGEMFRLQTDTNAVHIPYRGESAALVDLMAGHTKYHFGAPSSSIQHVKSGKLKAIAYGSKNRSKLLPDVPTTAEAGLPGFLAYTWLAVLAPAGTPQAVVDKLNASINRVLADEVVDKKLTEQGMEVIADSTSASTKKFIDDEMSKWEVAIKKAGMTEQ